MNIDKIEESQFIIEKIDKLEKIKNKLKISTDKMNWSTNYNNTEIESWKTNDSSNIIIQIKIDKNKEWIFINKHFSNLSKKIIKSQMEWKNKILDLIIEEIENLKIEFKNL